MKKNYTVYSLRLANQLVSKGFKIVGTGINDKNPKYNVFFFENTEEFRKVLKDITN